ncbi:MAG: hypothetical protein RL708_2159 [Bacteroidota bacterium]
MASLNAISGPLGQLNARHLLRRLCFKYSNEMVASLSTLTIDDALAILLVPDAFIGTPYDTKPEGNPDGYWTQSTQIPFSYLDQERKRNIVSGWWWFEAMQSKSAAHKMTHFLSTCFTVAKRNCNATDFYDYLLLLHYYSLGNYKTLAKKMTLNNAMLVYLNNNTNIKSAPNENYAREFMELFTIGKGLQIAPGNYSNYTEEDVVVAAKVLTGIKNDINRTIIDSETGIHCGFFDFASHNTESKIFSNSFNDAQVSGANSAAAMANELEDFTTMLFNQSATAEHICTKLYRYFVNDFISADVHNNVILPLANQLKAANYELAPVIKTLFASEHFFNIDENPQGLQIIGGLVKSPLQLFSEIFSVLHLPIPNAYTNPAIYYDQFWIPFAHNSFFQKSDMLLFDPPNVAGHPAHYQVPDFDKIWISSATLLPRFEVIDSILNGINLLSDEGNFIYPSFELAPLFSTQPICSDPTNPFILTHELCILFFGQEPKIERENFFMNTFLLEEQPPGDWTGLWSFYLQANFSTVVNLRLTKLIVAILKAPESQLF